MTNEIKLGEFDDVESANTWGILEILDKVKVTAPVNAKVEWQFPGYVSIVLSNGVELAFGESLERDSGYSWNDYAVDGTNNYADYIPDLGDIDLIVAKLWQQTAHLLEIKETN